MRRGWLSLLTVALAAAGSAACAQIWGIDDATVAATDAPGVPAGPSSPTGPTPVPDGAGVSDGAGETTVPSDGGQDSGLPSDGEGPGLDAQVDAHVDAQADAQVDAQVDAQLDAQADAQVDAQVDAKIDAQLDTPDGGNGHDAGGLPDGQADAAAPILDAHSDVMGARGDAVASEAFSATSGDPP